MSTFNHCKHITKGVVIEYNRNTNKPDHSYTILPIPWTKTERECGAKINVCEVEKDFNNMWAIQNHMCINVLVPGTAPLFSFATSNGGWRPVTKDLFLSCCNTIWSSEGMCNVMGHSLCIGGVTEHLLRGVEPDIVAVMGRWKSNLFYLYWREIKSILPQFMACSFTGECIEATCASMMEFKKKYNFKDP